VIDSRETQAFAWFLGPQLLWLLLMADFLWRQHEATWRITGGLLQLVAVSVVIYDVMAARKYLDPDRVPMGRRIDILFRNATRRSPPSGPKKVRIYQMGIVGPAEPPPPDESAMTVEQRLDVHEARLKRMDEWVVATESNFRIEGESGAKALKEITGRVQELTTGGWRLRAVTAGVLVVGIILQTFAPELASWLG
jgi:hypothetical protein